MLPPDVVQETLVPPGTQETAAASSRAWRTSCAVDVNGMGDAGMTGATVRVYAETPIGRSLLETGTVQNLGGGPERVLEVQGRGASRFTVTIQPVAQVQREIAVSLRSYGSEP